MPKEFFAPKEFDEFFRNVQGTERFLVPHSYCGSVNDMIKYVKRINPFLAPLKLNEIPDVELISSLVKYEKAEIVSTYKMGVLYVKEGQQDEDDMFSNGKDEASAHLE